MLVLFCSFSFFCKVRGKVGGGGVTPSVKAYGFATFPKGTAFGGGGKVCLLGKGVPLGELSRRKP